ncbi:two pore domain potassium channel family protein [Jiangella aurantiaca]|uniref:Two pore domain potassium channel family protein n=1 Tax=Jiangella aurantiaca TaxID=2530373 RepID=A0A4R4ZYD8_9ACTN|nr:potassium channel family protein [Jiangella aurantiaca]TDD64281.1 two pore domain potassium channel family protein [Jiangella aurantiaca]
MVSYVLRSIGVLTSALLVYYGLPLTRPAELSEVAGSLVFIAGVAGLILLIGHQVRRFAAHISQARTRVFGLLSVVYVVVVFFAMAYYLLERGDADQFDGLATRTDALYFSIVTLGTVGYGDVHPVGQEARIAAMVQIVFDLVVIGALFAIVSSQIAHRMNLVRAGHGREDTEPPDITRQG